MKTAIELSWHEVIWPRPFSEDAVRDLLTRLATMNRCGHLVFEVRAAQGRIRYLVGVAEQDRHQLREVFGAVLPSIRFRAEKEHTHRAAMTLAKSLKLSRPILSLHTNNTEAIIRAVLASLAQTKHKGDETVVQLILGQAYTPSLLPDKLPDPNASWLDALRGSIGKASAESKRLMKEKADCYGFGAGIRIGAVAEDDRRMAGYIRSVYAALKTAETVGTRLELGSDRAEALNVGKRPWHLPLRLSIKELPLFLGWPLGETEFSGVTGLHPRIMLVPKDYLGDKRSFGKVSMSKVPLGISAQDSLYHTVLLGPTGAGKSTAMLHLILADIQAGRSVLVIDPKADLVNDILERLPEERADEVVIIDPSDSSPVGLNPLKVESNNPALTADTVLAVLHDLFADSWGIRTQDILSAALMTLTQVKGASLVWLPALLTDDKFRRKILKNIHDPIGLDAFWSGFEAMTLAERNQVIAPVLNKLRQFLLRPELRAILGQSEPKFSMADIFHKRRIVLVPLNKGIIGQESARLLGSLIVGQLWALALGRAALPAEKRHIVNVYIDEVQDYLRLPGDLSDALSQARGLGLSLTLAHQFRNQLPAHLRAAIDANAQNKVIFGLNAGDAREMAAMAPELEAVDFMLLPRYAVYAALQYRGKSTGWISGRTAPPSPAIRSAVELKAKSMETYGRDAALVEEEYLRAIGFKQSPDDINPDEPIGRRKRGE